MSDRLALDRATYKKIKGFDRNQMSSSWLIFMLMLLKI